MPAKDDISDVLCCRHKAVHFIAGYTAASPLKAKGPSVEWLRCLIRLSEYSHNFLYLGYKYYMSYTARESYDHIR